MESKKSFKDRLMNFDNWKREGLNAVCVTVGLVGATMIDRLVQKGVDKWLPSAAPYVGYVKAGVSILGGLVLSVSAEEKTMTGEMQRMVGYGISSSGVLSGLRMIPAVNDLMSGKTTETPPAVSGIERLLGLSLGDFGNAENIRQISTADAEQINLDLPDLGSSGIKTPDYSRRENESEEEFAGVEDITAEVI